MTRVFAPPVNIRVVGICFLYYYYGARTAATTARGECSSKASGSIATPEASELSTSHQHL